jgi:hypothetical protein
MINNTNIRGYINYLYLQRNGTSAPQDLLNKWATLPAADIGVQLQKLYASWGLTLDASNAYEQQYTDAIAAALPKPNPTFTPQQTHVVQPHQTVQERPYVAPKKSSINAWIVGIALLAIIACGAAWILNSNKTKTYINQKPVENNDAAVVTAPIATPEQEQVTTAPIDEDSAAIARAKQELANNAATTTVSEQLNGTAVAEPTTSNNAITETIQPLPINYASPDTRNMQNIHQLLVAEEQRDFNTIYNYYSPNIERYWDIEYPTRDELQTRFTKVWKKSTNPKHSDVTVQKVGENKYIATGIYEYYHVASSTTKTVSFKNSFTFDDNGKIIETNEAK